MNDSPLARYLVPIRRWWWIVVGIVLITLGATFLTLPEQNLTDEELAERATQFRATHILIRNEEATQQLAFDLILLLSEQGDLTNRIVAATDGQFEPAEVQAVELTADPTIGTLTISAVQDTSGQAVELANVYAEELVTFLDERSASSVQGEFERVTEQIETVEGQIDGVQTEIAPLAEDASDRVLLQAELDGLVQEYTQLQTRQQNLENQLDRLTESFVTIQEPSPVPVEDEAVLALPNDPVVRLIVLALLSLIVGIVVVLVIDYLDTRVRTRREAEEAFGLPVVAEVPTRSRRARAKDPLPALSDPGGITAEIMRALTLSIELAPTWHLTSLARSADGSVGTKTPVAADDPPRTMVVTSPLTGDGKSTLVANLAVSFAEGGKRVLVVDCDFRRPAVGEFLGVEPGRGLRDLGRVDDQPIRELMASTDAPNVAMVRAGTQGVTPVWFREQLEDLIERCVSVADVVIFDTGPITLTNEASALLPFVDTSLLVARAGKVATDQARGAIQQMTQVGAHVSGVVLIGSESRRRYGYGYYTPSTEPTPRWRRRSGSSKESGSERDSAVDESLKADEPSKIT